MMRAVLRLKDTWKQARNRVLPPLLFSSVSLALLILGYYAWQTASQFTQLGEQALVQSTLLLVREKVNYVEEQIIALDNALLDAIDVDHPEQTRAILSTLKPNVPVTVTDVMMLDDSGEIIMHMHTGTERNAREFKKLFLTDILPDLELENQPIGRLKHLHRSYLNRSYLISYKAIRQRGRRFYVVARHDTEIIIRDLFPILFATEEGKRLYNVVDENNRHIYGRSLAGAGDYLVGRRFPTTLYAWRLQVAPKQAPLLEASGRTRRFTEVAMIAISFLVILIGVAFSLYTANKERRVSLLKSDFISNVSHELKTPLAVIRMFAEMLLTERVPDEKKKKEYLEIMTRESERLSQLIENVLDFAALEQGRQQYDMKEGDISEVIRRALETVRYRAETAGAQIRFDTAESVPTVRFDAQAILLALINLIDNAVKYGGGTPVQVGVSGSPKEVQVYVRDGGPGFPESDVDRVFERFYRSKNSGPVRGSGIGLSLVKQIAEAHGGKAWASNAVEGGAVVHFSIPTSA